MDVTLLRESTLLLGADFVLERFGAGIAAFARDDPAEGDVTIGVQRVRFAGGAEVVEK